MSTSGQGRARLSRDAIVAAALRLIESDGLSSLTMRSLGKALGVEAMAVYYYVNGREDLLDAVVEHLTQSARVDPSEPVGPSDGWQSYLQAVARSVRRVAVEHTQAFPLVATRHPAAPWLRPPLRSLDMVEDFLCGMRSRGMGDEAAVHVYRVFTSFLLGHLLLEVAVRGAETVPDEPLDEGDPSEAPGLDDGALDHHPTVGELQGRLAEHDADAEFDAALETLLNRLESDLSSMRD